MLSEIAFSCPILPADLIDLKLFFTKKFRIDFSLFLVHAIFQDVCGYWGLDAPIYISGN